MKRSAALLVFIAFFGSSFGQQASMSSPMISTSDSTVRMSVSFSSFSADQSYRLGIGCAVGDLAGATLELLEGDSQLDLPVATFQQGHNAEQWWGVKELHVRGYLLEGGTVPATGATLRLSVQIPLAVANEKGQLFLFVARKYAEGIWYLEDGMPIEEKHW